MTNFVVQGTSTIIRPGAFSGCSSLQNISISPDHLLYESKGGVLLTEDERNLVVVPGGLSGVFVVPDTVTNIYSHAFHGCTELTSVQLSSDLTGIGDLAFAGCSGMTTMTIPGKVGKVGLGAFAHCHVLSDDLRWRFTA